MKGASRLLLLLTLRSQAYTPLRLDGRTWVNLQDTCVLFLTFLPSFQPASSCTVSPHSVFVPWMNRSHLGHHRQVPGAFSLTWAIHIFFSHQDFTQILHFPNAVIKFKILKLFEGSGRWLSIQSAGWTHRGPRLISQHPCGVSKLSIILVPEDPVPFSGFLAHAGGVHRHTCRWNTSTQKRNVVNKNLKPLWKHFGF